MNFYPTSHELISMDGDHPAEPVLGFVFVDDYLVPVVPSDLGHLPIIPGGGWASQAVRRFVQFRPGSFTDEIDRENRVYNHNKKNEENN